MRLSALLDFTAKDIGFVPRDAVLRTIDKFDKIGAEGVFQLLTTGRTDQSGARIEGVGIKERDAKTIIEFMESQGTDNQATIANLRRLIDYSETGMEGVDELEKIASLLAAQGYGPDRIVIDPSVVRGLGYYTGPVFEAELTFEILDDKGRKRQFGSVAGGGRYDDLVKRFTGQSVPATGVSIGVDRLLAALRAKGRTSGATAGPVVVTVMDRERMAEYMAMAGELRAAGINVSFGQDCVMDPWYPLGQGCMLEVASMGIHVAPMTSREAMRWAFDAVTVNPARALHLEGYGLEKGCNADFVVLQAKDPIEAIRLKANRLKVVRRGKVIAETPERVSTLHLPGRPGTVNGAAYAPPARQ